MTMTIVIILTVSYNNRALPITKEATTPFGSNLLLRNRTLHLLNRVELPSKAKSKTFFKLNARAALLEGITTTMLATIMPTTITLV